jgi:hypothetical protein
VAAFAVAGITSPADAGSKMAAAAMALAMPVRRAEIPPVGRQGMRSFPFKSDLLDALAPGHDTGAWQRAISMRVCAGKFDRCSNCKLVLEIILRLNKYDTISRLHLQLRTSRSKS